MIKLLIVTTHPVQYYVPLFRMLASESEIDLMVFYTWGKDSVKKYDPGFGKIIEWDVPLLEGYNYKFLNNTATNPGSHHFSGIVNPEIISEIEQANPDVILFYGWAYKSHLQAIRYFKNKRAVWFRGDSTLLDTTSAWRSLTRSVFLRWIYRGMDKILYPGSSSKEYFLKCGVKEKQLLFVPHAIDNARFAENREAEAIALRKSLNIDREGVLVLFTGKFEKKKDPLALMDAFIELSDPKAHLLLVGDGILLNEMSLRAKNNHRIYIHPFVNQADIPVYYQSCDLFCLPSNGPGETWGLAVNEAMASGKAVLVSEKAGCAIDLVQDYQNGLTFNPDNSGNLTHQLQYLLSDRDQLTLMGKKSLEIISGYSFNNQMIGIKSILKKFKDV